MHHSSRIAVAGLLLLSGGCAGGQTGQEGPTPSTCPADSPKTTKVVGVGEPAFEGLSGADALRIAAGPFAGNLHWYHSTGPHAVTVSVTSTSQQARIVEFNDSQHGCPNRLEIDATLSLTSVDGSFDESLPTTLVLTSDGTDLVTAQASEDLRSLRGTYRPSAEDLANLSTPHLYVYASFAGASPRTVSSGDFLLTGGPGTDVMLAEWTSSGSLWAADGGAPDAAPAAR